jgi:hypothetical protein
MKNITINIISEGGTGGRAPSADAGADEEKEAEKASAEAKKKNVRVAAFSSYVTAQALATAKSMMQIGYDRYVTLTENYVAQTAVANMQNHINRFANVAGSTLGGAYLGAKLGPMGAIAGAVIGFVTSGIRNEISRTVTLNEQARAVHEEAYSLYFNTARAGMINHSRGTEN